MLRRRFTHGSVLFVCVAIAGTLTVACSGSSSTSPRSAASESMASSPGAVSSVVSGPDSANRILFWDSVVHITALSDKDLDRWKASGVGGFVVMVGYLAGTGGTAALTDAPDPDPAEPRNGVELALRGSDIARRLHARGMTAYLGLYFANIDNPRTPLAEWFDDGAWSKTVLPEVAAFAGGARRHGFDGIAVDQELYPQKDGAETATWDWTYPGNTHREAEVRAEATARGHQVMATALTAFPGMEIVAYGTLFPDTWNDVVQAEKNGVDQASAQSVQINFWDGMTSVDGYGAVRFMNALFYKTPQVGSWDRALQYEMSSMFSLMSRRFSNWAYASSRVSESPFSWIAAGTSTFERARSPAYVAEQLLAFRKWGMDGVFANYASPGLDAFDYRPYLKALQTAATPARVDASAPTLRVDPVTPAAGHEITLTGTATDDLAVRVVRWRADPGASGAATTEFPLDQDAGIGNGGAQVRWTTTAIALGSAATTVTVTVEDIKGNTTAVKVLLPAG